MSQPSVRAEIEAIETKINAGLQEDRTGQGWQLQLDGAQWGIGRALRYVLVGTR
jgi:hypothetical protein